MLRSGVTSKRKRVFYPDDLPTAERFRFYCRHFEMVEINNSFYQLPSRETFKNWRKDAPEGFIFSVKASRFIMDMKKLKEPEKSTGKFLSHIAPLKEKLGPVLFRLPPRWKVNAERLENFIESLPRNLKAVFEFRDDSWFDEKIYALLEKKKKGFCAHDMRGLNCPRLMVGGLPYIRFHGATSLCGGEYSRAQLKDWAGFIKQCAQKGGVYVYFNNDDGGSAVKNALELKKILGV